ncbi:MAG: hypothetical protein D6800_07330 [Candidatus Zixiibacteriota bacterium]|nr:MAG: hypothetical protein D6800_07330 [candidate division Zixibacteria bacterium]
MHHAHPEHPKGYEKREANVLGIALTAFAVIALIVIIGIILNDFFIMTREETIYRSELAPISKDRLALDARADSLLTTYGPVDSTGKVFRIPIERAMELIAVDSTPEAAK